MGNEVMAVDMEFYRKLEPISRVLRALAIPPPEELIPTPREIAKDLGIKTLEDILPPIKQRIRARVVKNIREFRK